MRVDMWNKSFPRRGDDLDLNDPMRAANAGRNEMCVQRISQNPNSWLVTSKHRLDNVCPLACGISERMLSLNQKGGEKPEGQNLEMERTSSSFIGWLTTKFVQMGSSCKNGKLIGGAWVAQSVKRPTSARSRSRGPWVRAPSGSGLMAQSLEPVSDSVSPSLSAPTPFMLSLCPKNK